jgi:hypothetical protein
MFMNIVACLIVALDCVQYALSPSPPVFAAGWAWVWFVFAAIWALHAIRNLVAD